MNKLETYSRRILYFFAFLLPLLSVGCFGRRDKNDVAAVVGVDVIAPVVGSTIPVNGATNVAINLKPAAIFSEAMNPETVSTATVFLKQGTTLIAGTVTYVGTTAIFTPTTNLATNTIYTATITTGAKDLASNAMAVGHTWTFTTATTSDTTPPTVSLTAPYGRSMNQNVTVIS